jgi:nitrite reductase/ring-hydroxylating ferredoxin subunit
VDTPVARCPRRSVVAAIRTVRRGEVVAARASDGEQVAVVKLVSGEVCVMADRCPHDGGLLSDGFVEGDRLVCARHHWEVDPRTGERIC